MSYDKSIAIMQPYLFPYIGYFQLIHSADRFVIYDDVQYIKNGWINRNIILDHNKPIYITLPIKNDHYQLPINKRFFGQNFTQKKSDILKTLVSCYNKAPYYKQTYEFIEHIFQCDDNNVANFITRSLLLMIKYLQIPVICVRSSNILNNKDLRGEAKILDICRLLRAHKYINAPGGINLYHKDEFKKNNINLFFIKSKELKYYQRGGNFIPNLSIIDLLMNNSVTSVKNMLLEYHLI